MPVDDFVSTTRDGYDRTAATYAQRFHHHLDDKPFDLAVLAGFAGLVRAHGRTDVLDLGCGSGATTALLAGHGVNPVGIDLSPNMVAAARRLNPGLAFAVGSMTDLDAADGSIGGICAWYSIIHVPDDHLPGVFEEFQRVLVPGGFVLLAFQIGDQPRVLTEAFGERLHLTFHRRRSRAVAALLEQAGLTLYATLERQADDDDVESTPQGYLIARKDTRS